MRYLKYTLAFFCFLNFGVQAEVHLTEQIDNTEVFDVYWAGFAFLGKNSERLARYPISDLISQEKSNGLSIINRSFIDLFKKINGKNPNLNIKPGLSTDPGMISMAVGLSYEDVYPIKYGDQYKTSYVLVLNIILFNFEEKKILTVYPYRALFNDSTSEIPSENKRKQVITDLYTGKILFSDAATKTKSSMLDLIAEKINSMKIRKAYRGYMGVRSVNIKDVVKDKIPEALLNNDVVKTQIAQEFEGYLSKNAFVPIVPYSGSGGGEAIAKNMTARFADRSIQLKLPEIDFPVDIDIRKFLKKVPKKAKEFLNYKSIITVRASSPMKEDYVNIKLSRNMFNLKKVSGDGSIEHDWSLYQLSLSKLLNAFTEQLAESTPKWTKKHSVSKDAKQQMENLRELIRKSQ